MRKVVIALFLIMVSASQAEVINCPSTREGKKLTDAAFFEWTTASASRTMAVDRMPLMPDDSRIEGDDWFQIWAVTHAVEGYGLQMVCKYQGLKAGLFIEVSEKVSVCTLTKKAGVVTAGCR